MSRPAPVPRCGSCRHASRRDPHVYSPETRTCSVLAGEVVMVYNSACHAYEPRTPSRRNNAAKKVKQQKGDTSMLNNIQVGQIHRISSTRVFNADKEGVTQTLSFVVNTPSETADKVLQLAEQGAPVYVQVGTLQERMPIRAEPPQQALPADDPKPAPRPRNKPASAPRSAGSGQDVNPQEEKPA